MADRDRDRPRITLEKSRTVRRRYQRSNKRFTFTASQIARIERKQEQEERAEKLRARETKRIAEKKKRVEKEAKAREERLRLGLPDPNAAKVPASQPLLFNFIKKAPSSKESQEQDDSKIDSGTESEGTVIPDDLGDEFGDPFGDDDLDLDDKELETLMAALDDSETPTVEEHQKPCVDIEGNDEDEFSDCSAFDDADVIRKSDVNKATINEAIVKDQAKAPLLFSQDSFLDDTAILLEEFAPEFDPGASFDQELAQLDAF
ncbi:hypothetical protein BJX99DRAFT_184547 [Aspergillus californicus]